MLRKLLPSQQQERPLVDLGSLVFRQDTVDHNPYALFAPQHYEPGYAYPLLVWLHGTKTNERQIQKVMPFISMRNYVGVAPALKSVLSTSGGFEFAEAEETVSEAIGTVQDRFHIRDDRVFLVGCDAGGTLAIRIGLASPSRFAGVISLGGSFPRGELSLTRLKQVRDLPILLAARQESDRYPMDDVCQDLRLFHSAGMWVSLRQYPVKSELTTQMLGDANRWMMEIVTSRASC